MKKQICKIIFLFMLVSISIFSATPRDVYIYSQIPESSLVESDMYIIDFYEDLETIKTINDEDPLLEILKKEGGYTILDIFTQDEEDRYSYQGDEKPVIEFKLNTGNDSPLPSNFSLTLVTSDGIYKEKIDEDYVIPGSITNFSELDLERDKNTFVFQDTNDLIHVISYKYREVLFRLYKGDKKGEVRPIKQVEDLVIDDDIVSGNEYIDFVFKNNNTIQTIEKNGIYTSFLNGKFEISGLKNDEDYKLDFYTLNYRDDDVKNNYVVVTNESTLNFKGKNIDKTNELVWVKDIDISSYKDIKINLLSIANSDIDVIDLEDLKEERLGITRDISNLPSLNKVSIAGEEVRIEGESYIVDTSNKINLNGTDKYIYKWEIEYETLFEENQGEERKVSFKVTLDNLLKDEFLISEKYLEPFPVSVDTRIGYQNIMFNFSGTETFKNQSYTIQDRVLSPEREGYKKIKTINYQSNLEDYILGLENYSLVNDFTFEDGKWNYPSDEGVEGLIIQKTITESKGILTGEDGQELIFYTDKTGDGLDKLEEIGNKVAYKWHEGPLNTNGEILNYDKVVFRITKGSSVTGDPIFYWDPYENENLINYIDESLEGNERLERFLTGDGNYVDLVLDANNSKTITLNNAIISYESTNKELRILGLTVGDYIIQFYSIKRGHSGDYKVITYEGQDSFKMDIPEIASEEFAKENNVHNIDFITVGENSGDIEISVNFITKMEREIVLSVENLKSEDFNIEETNEGTGVTEGIGEASIINLEESGIKKFLYPLDIVFVIDNSGSMQNEIDAVKEGLAAFGKDLLERGFDVKYNLIVFGPFQSSNRIGSWTSYVNWYDDGYMAIYKDSSNNKWFNGSTKSQWTKDGEVLTDIKDIELAELTDAFDNIIAGSGYDQGQENSAWGIDYATKKLRENGRYLSYSGEIVEDSSDGYLPSEKMIILLTDENMDSDLLPSGYAKETVLRDLYANLNQDFNGLPDNINLNGLFHIRKRGNGAIGASSDLTFYGEEGVPSLGHKYTWGRNIGYWEEWDDNEPSIIGIDPSDTGDIYHNDFKLYNTGNNFFMYEMGSTGENITKSLSLITNNLGIIQRWNLVYLTPFNEYDGTTRTVNFDLINLIGVDGTLIEREIKNLNEEEDKQYTVKEQKLALEFVDPSVDNLKLNIVDGRGYITFRGKARYNEFDSNNNPIVVEDIIKEYKLDVLDPNNNLLFSRNTDSIEATLSDSGWLETNIIKSDLNDILEGKKTSWVDVKADNTSSGEKILSTIDKARYLIEGNLMYKLELSDYEVQLIKESSNQDGEISFEIDGTPVKLKEEDLKSIVESRSNTWYELHKLSSSTEDLDSLIGENFEKVSSTSYRIKLADIDLMRVLEKRDSTDPTIQLKVSNTKLEELNEETIEDTFGDQGWYNYLVEFTEEEMEILINSELVRSQNKINLQSTIATELFNKTAVLNDVLVELSTPKITNISFENTTLSNFLLTIRKLDKMLLYTPVKGGEDSSYNISVNDETSFLPNGSYAKKGDKVNLVLEVVGINIDIYDVAYGVTVDGWNIPTSIEFVETLNDGKEKFRLIWKDYIITEEDKTVSVFNNIENNLGIKADNDIPIIKVRNEDIDIAPVIENVEIIDGVYYINSNYNIDIGSSSEELKDSIITLEYNKEKADQKENGDYYGDPDYYNVDASNIFGGGENFAKITNIIVDEIDHKNDGEYKVRAYGMSNSGKLNDITNYDGDFEDIIWNSEKTPENILIVVDTVDPMILDLKIEREDNIDSNSYYFNLTFQAKDYNMKFEKLMPSKKGGYEIVEQDGVQVISESIDSNGIVTSSIKIPKSNQLGEVIGKVKVMVEDKAGNQVEEDLLLEVPEDITLKTYEELYQTDNLIPSKDGYKFTKGGQGSYAINPLIYAEIPTTDPSSNSRITRLRVEKYDGNNSLIGIKEVDVNSSEEAIAYSYAEGVNHIKVTPISFIGIQGKTEEIKFVLDTKINTSYLEGGIIDELSKNQDGKLSANIEMSELTELSGVASYEYILRVGSKVLTGTDLVDGNSYTTLSKDSSLESIEIDITGLTEGSQGILEFTVHDKLGHQKTFKKTYFIPKQATGITSKLEGESRQRESKIRIITEGTDEDFGVESVTDKSSED